GVMLGRVAYHDPYLMAQADWRLFDDHTPARSLATIVRLMASYAARQVQSGTPLRAITRHVLGLYHGQPGGRRFRQILSDARRLADGDAGLLLEALAATEPLAPMLVT